MTIQKINDDVIVTSGDVLYTVVDAFVKNYSNASMALLAVAERFGIAVNYMDRGVVEGKLGRVLTDDEWVQVAPHLVDGYDERIDDTWNVSDVQGEFVHEACRLAGVDTEGGE